MHSPSSPNGSGLVLTHGAGGNSHSKLLVAVAEAFAASGLYVLRYDLPFRQKRASGPPFGNGAEDRRGLSEACRALRDLAPDSCYCGGHSYGGRQASILAVEEPKACDGLLLLSYPLHPPKQPERLRTGHFPDLQSAVLFVQGSRDPFGAGAEFEAAADLIPGRKAIVWIKQAGHDLRQGEFEISAEVVAPFGRLMRDADTGIN